MCCMAVFEAWSHVVHLTCTVQQALCMYVYICIIIVTVPRGAFAFNISGTLTDLNYLSEDRCLTFEETVHLSQLKFLQFCKLLHIS